MADSNEGCEFLIDDFDDDVTLSEEDKQCPVILRSITTYDKNKLVLPKVEEFMYDSTGTSSTDSSPEKHTGCVLCDVGKLTSLSKIMEWPANLWNKHAAEVYNALKVKCHIVKPNYFLSANLQGPPKTELNMDDIFLEIKKTNSSVPCWSKIQHHFEPFFKLFEFTGSKQLANNLACEPLMAVTSLKAFTRKLTQHKSQFTDPLHTCVNKIIQAARSNQFSEDLSKLYVEKLLHHFTSITQIFVDFGLFFSKELAMKLHFEPTRGKIIEKVIKPDFIGECSQNTFLVGEAKKLRQSKSEVKTASQESLRKEPVQEDDTKVAKRKLDDDSAPGEGKERDSAKRKRATEGSTFDQNSSEQDDVTSDLASEQISAKHEPAIEVSTKVKTADNDCVKPSGSDEKDFIEKDGASGDTSKQDNEKRRGYRDLRVVELKAVSHYLPQLLAGMLASLQESIKEDNVQLGFAVEGFKLRLVRLVLWQKSNENVSVNDLKKPDVQCHVFLTKEIDLFRERHVRLFFQFLYAICYMQKG